MSTRPTDPRCANRRGSDNTDLGYANIEPARVVTGTRWPSPRSNAEFATILHKRATSGACVVCGEATTMPGVTCKEPRCIRAFLFGQVDKGDA